MVNEARRHFGNHNLETKGTSQHCTPLTWRARWIVSPILFHMSIWKNSTWTRFEQEKFGGCLDEHVERVSYPFFQQHWNRVVPAQPYLLVALVTSKSWLELPPLPLHWMQIYPVRLYVAAKEKKWDIFKMDVWDFSNRSALMGNQSMCHTDRVEECVIAGHKVRKLRGSRLTSKTYMYFHGQTTAREIIYWGCCSWILKCPSTPQRVSVGLRKCQSISVRWRRDCGHRAKCQLQLNNRVKKTITLLAHPSVFFFSTTRAPDCIASHCAPPGDEPTSKTPYMGIN